MTCPVCGSATTDPLGSRQSDLFPGRAYALRRCPDCRFAFVADPCTDFARLYDEAYYHGRGADPLVDYAFEQDHPDRTVRRYEWRGLTRVARALLGKLTPATRWLDFGCGNGGLVRYVRDHVGCTIVGHDTGWATTRARDMGLPILGEDELDGLKGSLDLVTAVEVIEHVPDPVAVLRRVRGLLRPGGVLLLTTGNAEPFRGRLLDWGYVRPDIHVSYFEPQTLARALRAAGFEVEHRGFLPGHADVIRFKVLKNLRVRQAGGWERLVPWPVVSRAVDRRYRVTAHPIGRVPNPPP